MERISIGPCKCGEYGQVLNEKTAREARTCHFPIGEAVALLVAKDAKHFLRCRHCYGRAVSQYAMKCIPLGITKTGRLKVKVFGRLYWRDTDHISRVRYVDPCRVSSIAGSPYEGRL